MEAIYPTYCYDVAQKRGIVQYFYEKEPFVTWHQQIHKRRGTVEENVNDTLDSISDSSVMYVVNVGGKLGAYFVWHSTPDGELVLEGFHVLAEFRNSDFLTNFWEIVKSKFDGSFKTGIYCKNEPAIKSLLKAGFDPYN